MEPLIDAALAARLVREQHPSLAAHVELASHGWDNEVFRLGDSLAIRLPRREIAVRLMLNEQHWLPTIAELVRVSIPIPVAAGEPTDEYPYPWSIVPWFDGEPPLDSDNGLAVALADFVNDLHVPAPGHAPTNAMRGVPLRDRDAAIVARLASLDPALLPIWRSAVAADPWAGPPLWLHGDLHPANVLARDGHITAVIDFGDITSGDPATDLAAAWLFFDEPERRVFMNRIDADDHSWRRARGWAVALATAFITGSTAGSPMIPLGHTTIRRLLTDEGPEG